VSERLTYIEIDVPRCALRYGETTEAGTCPAVLGVDSDLKCFNSRSTCPVLESFEEETVTLRFAKDAAYLPRDIDAIPLVTQVNLHPATLSLGKDLGIRAALDVTFKDSPDPDTHPAGDKYVAERGYDPFEQGTFWGKWRARLPGMRGCRIRLIRGERGQALEEMTQRHYIVESSNGPDTSGTFRVMAHDPLIMLLGDRALAPRPSNGFLVAPINTSETAVTLSPAGIGNLEYPASGHVCIGGNEVCAFTRTADALTLTRAQLGSTARAHEAEERVQLVLRYDGEDPADILADLFETYADVDPAWIPLANWQLETDTYLKRVYGTAIVEPTPVKDLAAQLIEQAALAVWWDDVASQIRLMVLRNVPAEAQVLDADLYLRSTLKPQEQPDKRVSQAWTYYGVRDPTQPLTNKDNYRSSLLTVDLTSEADHGGPAIKEIMARWIPAFGRTTAERVNNLQIGRYRNPPRKFNLALFKGATPPVLAPGLNFQLGGWPIQDASGARALAPAIVTRLGDDETSHSLELEEAFFAEIAAADLFNRVIIVDGSTLDFNLRTVHDSLFPEIVDPYGIMLTCIIAPNVTIGSSSVASAGFTVGDWVPGLPIVIRNQGNILGKGGGDGYSIGNTLFPAGPGGPALYTRYPITVENDGIIGGGGGASSIGFIGGNYRAGGGGAGYLPGAGSIRYTSGNVFIAAGQPGSLLTGGEGEVVSPIIKGGDLGQPGGLASPVGLAGDAIDGVSYITFDPSGDIRGDQIN
jgi:hypothetical protein